MSHLQIISPLQGNNVQVNREQCDRRLKTLSLSYTARPRQALLSAFSYCRTQLLLEAVSVLFPFGIQLNTFAIRMYYAVITFLLLFFGCKFVCVGRMSIRINISSSIRVSSPIVATPVGTTSSTMNGNTTLQALLLPYTEWTDISGITPHSFVNAMIPTTNSSNRGYLETPSSQPLRCLY